MKHSATRLIFFFSFLIFSVLSMIAMSQGTTAYCGTDEYMRKLVSSHRHMKYPAITDDSQWMPASRINGIVVIPVVVHVVHKGEPVGTGTNISPAQVESQIVIINDDFRGTNTDVTNVPAVFTPYIADSKIQFCLATLDPDSNPTSGIIYKQTSEPRFVLDNRVKFDSTGGSNAWPADRYLNIWVCDLQNANGDNLLGYAQFPGGPPETDGIVVRYEAFGNKGNVSIPYNKGRTTTHEVGHWLNLSHIWGDNFCGNDFVGDTPVQEGPNYGNVVNGAYMCPAFPHVTCNNGPNGDMFMNYMDYTFDKCMNMFTNGQSKRMNRAIDSLRASFLNVTNLCVPPVIAPDTNIVKFDLVTNSTLSDNIAVLVIGSLSTNVEVEIYSALGQRVHEMIFARDNIAGSIIINFPDLTTGFYYLHFYANNTESVLKFFKAH